jgi:hypothetical protein
VKEMWLSLGSISDFLGGMLSGSSACSRCTPTPKLNSLMKQFSFHEVDRGMWHVHRRETRRTMRRRSRRIPGGGWGRSRARRSRMPASSSATGTPPRCGSATPAPDPRPGPPPCSRPLRRSPYLRPECTCFFFVFFFS